MPETQCAFCFLARRTILAESSNAVAFPDGFPVAEGHTLVIPRAHVQSVFSLSDDHLAELWSLVQRVRVTLAKTYGVSDFTIGVNDGPLAGQTVIHGHIHVIPRRSGDVEDPRGGVRWILGPKARYWE